MKMNIKHLQARGGRLRYRRKIPMPLRPYFGGKSEIVHSLGLKVGQEMLAVAMVGRIDRDTDRLLAAAEQQSLRNTDPYELSLIAEAWARDNKYLRPDDAGRRADPGHDSDYDEWLHETIAKAERAVGLHRMPHRELELDDLEPLDRAKIMTVKAGKRVEAPLTIQRATDDYAEHRHGGTLKKAEEVALKQLREFLGPDQQNIADVTRATAREFLKHLAHKGTMGQTTVRRRLSSLRAVFTFAIDHHDLEVRNPWSGLELPRMAGGGKESHKRLPFSREHLGLINRYLQSNSIDPNIRVLLVLLRETGCRPLEIAGLISSDVFLSAPVPHVWIRANAVRRIKTKESERRVPLTQEARGALRQVMPVVCEADTPLFPKTLRATSNLSQRLNKAIREAGVPKSPRLVSYSFRHSLTEAIRVSQAPEYHLKAIMGHSAQSITDNYGAGGVDLGALLRTIEDAWPFLGEVPEHVYEPRERAPDGRQQ
ncbi:MAG: tyrosine-type recombinase/integrase [Hyphomonas sp.]|nr:tyrosine-type recombinase/integrase [Hyphomonas sp.]